MEIKAKDASLVAKFISSGLVLLGLLVMILLVIFKLMTADEAFEMYKCILASAFSLLGIFGTVDLNIMLEKFAQK